MNPLNLFIYSKSVSVLIVISISKRIKKIKKILKIDVISSYGMAKKPFLRRKVIAIILAPIVLARGTLNAAAILHHDLLKHILGNAQRFFDTVPKGRILARFSSDVNIIDSILPMKFKQIIIFFFRVGA